MVGSENNSFFTSSPSRPTAPPPPPEVKVRTMRSDLAAMAKSGGGMPQFESVKVPGLAFGKGVNGIAAVSDNGKKTAIIVVMVIAAVAALALIGFLVYDIFFASPTSATSASVPAVESSGDLSSSKESQTGANTFAHESIFSKPADQMLALTLSTGGATANAADLQTFGQKLTTLLGQVKKIPAMIEVKIQRPDGGGIPVSDVLEQEGTLILGRSFLDSRFNPDGTFFVYMDKNGSWPGWVLALNADENWLFLKDDISKLESSPSISNFFLQNVGTAAPGGFIDANVSSTPVRSLLYPGANPPAVFFYAWVNGKLILSTSRDGFAEALERLR